MGTYDARHLVEKIQSLPFSESFSFELFIGLLMLFYLTLFFDLVVGSLKVKDREISNDTAGVEVIRDHGEKGCNQLDS